MRSHAVADDGLGVADDDDEPGPCARGAGGEDGPSTATTTHVYALRANPNRLTRGCQVCKNCGKEFSSMELFLEHGKCTSGEDEDADGSPHSSPPSVADGEEDASLATGWSKGKRSLRAKLAAGGGDDMPATSTAPSRCGEEEEEDLANCLVMLSSRKADQAGVAEAGTELCASASKDHGIMPQQPQPISFVMPAPDPAMVMPLALPAPMYASPVPRGMFECKACKKVFTSHQALGGHRASHKKVKGCFAAKAESGAIEPTHHAPAASGLNDDKGSAIAAVEVNAGGSSDVRTNVDVTAGETHAGTSEAAAAPSLSMAITTTDHDPTALAIPACKKKAKMHECSVCHRLFSSGQALGGHKRCHWLTSGTGDHTTIPQLTAEGLVAVTGHQLTLRPMVDAAEPALDLTIAANPLPAIAIARATEVGTSSVHLDASAPYLQTTAVPSNPTNQNKLAATSSHDVNDAVAAAGGTEDEADSTTVKKARLSDLKDESTAGEITPWLQVGLGSSSAGGDGKSAAE
jgi:hypothetical protein